MNAVWHSVPFVKASALLIMTAHPAMAEAMIYAQVVMDWAILQKRVRNVKEKGKHTTPLLVCERF